MSLKETLQSIPAVRSLYQSGKSAIESARIRIEKSKRAGKYGRVEAEKSRDIVEKLRRDGIAIVKNAIDKELLLEIRAELEAKLDSGRDLKRISKDSQRAPSDIGGSRAFLTPEEMARGQEYYRAHANYASVDEPLVDTESTVKAAFHEPLVEIASEYFGCQPALGSLNLRKSFLNSLKEFDTLHFHCDDNSPDFLKYFFYLNDVDLEGGPFCFIRGSHRNKFAGWRSKYRWTYDEMLRHYPKEDILSVTAGTGDLIIANTAGFHRGTKVLSKERCMLTLDWVVYPEYWGKGEQFQIRRDLFERLSPRQKIWAEFLKPVERKVRDGKTAGVGAGY